jgi:hypothetical protein
VIKGRRKKEGNNRIKNTRKKIKEIRKVKERQLRSGA